MGLWEQFPYTDFHNLNADWILQQTKYAVERVDSLLDDVQKMIDDADAKFQEQFNAFRIEINNTINQLNIAMKEFEERINAQFADYKKELEAQVQQALRDVQALIDKFQAEINDQLSMMRVLIRDSEVRTRAYVDGEIQKVIDMIPEITSVYVRNPATGVVMPIQQALDELNNLYRYFALSCVEYSERNWTAEEYDGLDFTAIQYDFYAKERYAWVSPFTGQWFSTYEWLVALTAFHKENALTASEYDNLGITAQFFDDLELSAYNYDFNGKTLIHTR